MEKLLDYFTSIKDIRFDIKNASTFTGYSFLKGDNKYKEEKINRKTDIIREKQLLIQLAKDMVVDKAFERENLNYLGRY